MASQTGTGFRRGVAFVEGLTPEMSEKAAYVTHVPTGSQAILDREGKVVGRHDGRADGPSRLDAVLEDDAAMARITAVLTNRKGARPRDHTILWVPLMQFGGIQYVRAWHFAGEEIREGERDLTAEDLGPEIYRVAFRGAGYAGPNYRIQDGDATFLNPGTQVYAVKATRRSSSSERWRKVGQPSMKPTRIHLPKPAGTCWTYGARLRPSKYSMTIT